MKKYSNYFSLIFIIILLASCANNITVPEGASKATMQIVLPKYTTAGDVRLALAGKLECGRFLGITKGKRHLSDISSLTKFSDSKPTIVPAGEDKMFAIFQEMGIADRVGAIYWTMFVNHNASYKVIVKNIMQDKLLFGQYISYFNIEVLENETPIAIIIQRSPDQECEDLGAELK